MKILLVGAGGWGGQYIERLLHHPTATLEGIVDPYYENCYHKAQVDAAGIPVYDTMDAFYASHTAELAIISTPTFLHREQSICALAHGSYVLCEKPVAPTVEEADAMLRAQEQYGKWIAIGYQWSFSDAIQGLKRDLLDGVLGKPVLLKTAVSWPRDRAYYRRGGGWGGRVSKDGVMILDSIAANACAHYLHNMLFLLGETMETSADVTALSGETRRAYPIENFDTCDLRMKTASGAELVFIASHAAEHNRNPEFVYRFEKATVTFCGGDIRAVFTDGTEKNYGDPFADDFKKLADCIAAAQNGTTPICTVGTARAHTRVIEKIYKECPVADFPKERIREREGADGVYVDGLFEEMYRAYEDA